MPQTTQCNTRPRLFIAMQRLHNTIHIAVIAAAQGIYGLDCRQACLAREKARERPSTADGQVHRW